MTGALGMRVEARAATSLASVVPFGGIDADRLAARGRVRAANSRATRFLRTISSPGISISPRLDKTSDG